MPPASWMSSAVKRPPGHECGHDRGAARRCGRSRRDRSGMPELVRDGEQVQHRRWSSRRSRRPTAMALSIAGRVMMCDGRMPPLTRSMTSSPACVGGVALGRVGGRDAVEATGADAHELERGAHRVGRELAAARTRPRARRVLDLAQLVERDLAGPIGADRLVHRHHGGVALAAHHAGVDRAVVERQAGQVQPRQGHRRAGERLVAADQADQPVEEVPARDELDRVGDHLARDERGLHALGAHADAVGHRRPC